MVTFNHGLKLNRILSLFIMFNFAFLNFGFAFGNIIVTYLHSNGSIAEFRDREAAFGPSLPDEGITGQVVYVNPHSACKEVDPPPGGANITWIAVIARGDNCDFSTKIYNVQIQGFAVAIVRNYPGHEDLVPMGESSKGDRVHIPSVFVGYTNGMDLAYKYNYTNKSVLVTVTPGMEPPNYAPYLYPFVIVVGTCFCLMVIFMIARWCRDVRSQQRSRLSKKHLKKIPVKKFKKGDYYDVCAICLDEYEEGDKMRILPCDHAYHVKCIDPWLTKNKKTCPVCKRRVIPGRDNSSDSEDSEEEENGHAPSEVTPLIGSIQRTPTSGPSTFNTTSSVFAASGLPATAPAATASTSEVCVLPTRKPSSSDSSSEESEEGAVGGDTEPPEEILVEHISEPEAGKINVAFVADDVVDTSQTKELNQVV